MPAGSGAESATLKASRMAPPSAGEFGVPDGEPEDLMLGTQPAQQLFEVRAGGEFVRHDEEQRSCP